MGKVTVRSLNETGALALEKCIVEEKAEIRKRPWQQRMIFSKVWRREVKPDPFRYELEQNPESLRFVKIDLKQVVGEIEVAMQKNGAMKGIDFFIEVDP